MLGTWLKIKNGYPLANSWGMPLHPKKDGETTERVRLLTTENVQLRAELGSIKDRLETLERIATDQPTKLARDIDALNQQGRECLMGPGDVFALLIVRPHSDGVMITYVFNRSSSH